MSFYMSTWEGEKGNVLHDSVLSFIMQKLVETDALTSSLVHPFGTVKYNLKMSDLMFCFFVHNFSGLLIYGLAVWQNRVPFVVVETLLTLSSF